MVTPGEPPAMSTTEAIVEPLHRAELADAFRAAQVSAAVAEALVDASVEPPYEIASPGTSVEPWLTCARLYWALRLEASPTLDVAAACARWLTGSTTALPPEVRHEIVAEWAVELGRGVRAALDPSGEFAGADLPAFVSLLHAAGLHASDQSGALAEFLGSPQGAAAEAAHAELVAALQVSAAYGGSQHTTEHAGALLDEAWSAAATSRTVAPVCLAALADAAPFEGQDDRLVALASEVATVHPEDPELHLWLATAQRRSGSFTEARASVDVALALLGQGDTPRRRRYLAERRLIEVTEHHHGNLAVPPSSEPGPIPDPPSEARIVALVAIVSVPLLLLVLRASVDPPSGFGEAAGRIVLLSGALLLASLVIAAAVRLAAARVDRG